jgi:CAAX prenyl protease-like protein
VPIGSFPLLYTIKAAAVTLTLVVFRAPLRDLRADPRVIPSSLLVGLIVFGLWVFIHELIPYPTLGTRLGFDPTTLKGSGWWPAFLGIRLYGLVLMVPVMEEVFWRSFLLRYLTAHDFRSLPMGTFSASALAIMVAASAAAHPEWVVAIVASLAYALWLRRTRSLFAVVVAHAATNAALGGYVLATGKWLYW